MIPNTIHFIFGLEKDFGGRPFSIFHYLSIKSAFIVNKPGNIFFYYKYKPEGVWWNKAREFITPVEVSAPEQIFGRKLLHYAHKADVLRIMVLLKFGGIYLDIDTICVKPLTPLLQHSCVMAEEKYFNVEHGLCNAVILAEKKSVFLQYWLSSYKEFRSKGRDEYWAEHSVRVPLRIARLYPETIHIEQENSFYYPSYSFNDLRLLFEDCEAFPDAYTLHLWESLSYDKYLSGLNEDILKKHDTSYNVIARKFL